MLKHGDIMGLQHQSNTHISLVPNYSGEHEKLGSDKLLMSVIGTCVLLTDLEINFRDTGYLKLIT